MAEETLKKLLVEQRHKVEELKKKTDYYSTQKLLERYDQPVRPTQPFVFIEHAANVPGL